MIVHGVEYSVGADPEVFVSDSGNFISAHGLVPGTKRKPHIVENGAVQVDGMALEFNIAPATSKDQFIEYVQGVKNILESMVAPFQVMECASVNFSEELFSNVPKFNQRIGCEGDYNAWTLDANPAPKATTLMRTAGGHVHVGGIFSDNPFKMRHFSHVARLARIMDEEIGIPSLFWDDDDSRRSMYGKAGCFRPKKYGMEYRTLSNRWIYSEGLISRVYDGVEASLEKFSDPLYEPSKEIERIINSSDRPAARERA